MTWSRKCLQLSRRMFLVTLTYVYSFWSAGTLSGWHRRVTRENCRLVHALDLERFLTFASVPFWWSNCVQLRFMVQCIEMHLTITKKKNENRELCRVGQSACALCVRLGFWRFQLSLLIHSYAFSSLVRLYLGVKSCILWMVFCRWQTMWGPEMLWMNCVRSSLSCSLHWDEAMSKATGTWSMRPRCVYLAWKAPGTYIALFAFQLWHWQNNVRENPFLFFSFLATARTCSKWNLLRAALHAKVVE